MSAQELYRIYRPYAVELGRKHRVALHDALQALARAATQCPSGIEPSAAAQFMRERVEAEMAQESAQGGQRRRHVA